MTTLKPRLRWFQYSLRSLLVLMVLVSIGMSWFAVKMQRARKQKEAVEAIKKLGGEIQYDYEVRQAGNPLPRVPPGPAWLRNLLGDDFFASAVGVFFPPSVTDAGLEHLKGLRQLQRLGLSGTQVSDAGLERLKGLTQLLGLSFYNSTQVSDAGLAYLNRLTQLQWHPYR